LKYRCIFLFWLGLTCSFSVWAQDPKKKNDSTKVYREIEEYSKRSKLTKFVHKLIFEPVVNEKTKKSTFQKTIKTNFASYECKVIRNIHITTLDPFGYSETDTIKKPKRKNDRLGNALHHKTRDFTIKNLLLYKKNDFLDSLLIKESERLIRNQRFVRGVSTRMEQITEDSVDVYIRVLDSWSLVPEFSSTTSNSTFKVTERNFLGIGHELSGTYRESLISKDNSFSTSYFVPTIFKSFIRANLNYQKEVDGSFGKFINIERPFFSAYSHWAGGIYVDQQYKKIVLANRELAIFPESYKYNSQEYWLGYSFPFLNGKTEHYRTTNFFVAARHLQLNFSEQPSINYDLFSLYSTEKQYLASVGFASRKFTQDKYLFNFNVTEDIASGFIYSLTAGNQHKNNADRFYFGGRVAIGRFYPFGYFSTNFEYGTFFRKDKTEQSVMNWSLVYFTNLIELGEWKFRQFVKPQFVIGLNRLSTSLDRLSLNGDTGLQGFESTTLLGTKKALIYFQTQSYSPWNVLGFRLNPYLSYSMGMLSGSEDSFKNSKMYSQVGAGVIVSNDFLVFNSFQFSFSYFPSIPAGSDAFKTNSIRSYDLTLPNFEIPKPSVVSYR
jgi:hypothetical protein